MPGSWCCPRRTSPATTSTSSPARCPRSSTSRSTRCATRPATPARSWWRAARWPPRGSPRSRASWCIPTARSTCPTTSSTSTATRRRYFTPGDHGASIRVDGLELGLSICYDGCFPEHARAAAEDGAVAYLSSSAYFAGAEHRRDLYYAARAVENGMYVVFAGLTGPVRVARLQRRLRGLRPRGPPARPARHRARRRGGRHRHRRRRRHPRAAHDARRPPRRRWARATSYESRV